VVAPIAASVAPVVAAVSLAPIQTSAAPIVIPVVPVPPAPLNLDWSSGLTQIETGAEKAHAAQQAVATAPAAPRVRRTRPALPPVIEEPLMQVETQNPPQTP